MNARYCIAVALAEGAVLPDQFQAAKLADPDIVGLAERIELVADPALDEIYPTHYVGWVEIENGAGEFEREYLLDPSGAIANPNREAGLRAKFQTLMAERLGLERMRALERAVDDLESISTRALVDHLTAV